MPSREGNRPYNLDLSSLKPLPNKREVGWGVKKPESQANVQSRFPENREQLEQRYRLVVERGLRYFHTAERIMEAIDSRSSKHDPQELLKVAELLSMKSIGLAEALTILEGEGEEQRNQIEEMEKPFPNYTNIVAEFSDENKTP